MKRPFQSGFLGKCASITDLGRNGSLDQKFYEANLVEARFEIMSNDGISCLYGTSYSV